MGFPLPSHIYVSETDVEFRDTTTRIDSALLGDVMASKRVGLIHGNLNMPELDPVQGWRPLGAIVAGCLELGISLGRTDQLLQRINPISDSVGQFVFSVDETGRGIRTDDSHIPCLAISKLRVTPRLWPTRLGWIRPLDNREAIQVLGGPPFRAAFKGSGISEHNATDALWWSAPPILRYLVFQHYIKLPTDSSDESRGVDEDVNPFSHPPSGAVHMIEGNVALYRAGSADEPARCVGQDADDDSSSSDIQPWAYRSYPETDPCPTQQTLLGGNFCGYGNARETLTIRCAPSASPVYVPLSTRMKKNERWHWARNRVPVREALAHWKL